MQPTVVDIEGIRLFDGSSVSLVGIYMQHDVRKGLRRQGPVEFYGDVVIVLDDGTEVLLYPIWHKEKIRPSEEIEQFENEKVVVKGDVFAVAPSSEENLANLLMPCITDIKQIAVFVE